jgi:hypothetical protein
MNKDGLPYRQVVPASIFQQLCPAVQSIHD